MKSKILTFITCLLLLFFNLNITTYAAANLSVLKNGGYSQMSMQDKQDTIVAMINKIAKDTGIKLPVKVSCYEFPEGARIAYSYTLNGAHTICVNLSMFEDDEEAKAENATIEHCIVNALAHEVRHLYQFEHQNDDSDYGRQCADGWNNYKGYYSSGYEAYYNQFVEQDARTYGESYADKYVKNGRIPILIAKNGKKFDAQFYADKYPDVKQALGTDPQVLLNHYNTYGINENRMANAGDIK